MIGDRLFETRISFAFEKRYNQLVEEGDGFENEKDAYIEDGTNISDIFTRLYEEEKHEKLQNRPKLEIVEKDKKVCIVSQTTFNYNKFQELVEIIAKKEYNIIVLNTICNATEERQTEARRIAKEVDAMIVIGDKNSSNTQKLFEICNTECEKTYYIQTSKDMDYSLLESINNVGITAGASTPNNIIEEVSKNVRNELWTDAWRIFKNY